MFKVGQKVVCINDTGISGLPVLFIKTGEIYTISGFYNCKGCNNESVMIKGLENVLNQVCGICRTHHEKRAYTSSRFRPLDETFAEEVLERIKEQINEEELVKI